MSDNKPKPRNRLKHGRHPWMINEANVVKS